jgi:predicted transcriptional regulator
MATTQGIKLDDNIRKRIKVLANKRQRSSHWLMKTAIEDYLEHEERYEKEKEEDNARWEHYLMTGKAIDHEKVETWLKDLSQGKPRKWQE